MARQTISQIPPLSTTMPRSLQSPKTAKKKFDDDGNGKNDISSRKRKRTNANKSTPKGGLQQWVEEGDEENDEQHTQRTEKGKRRSQQDDGQEERL